ncbi:MAG TPA: ABC transporter ATP-binding protein [Candidatus Deferrimicrobiaceae bacterium]|nr:ABC transporter ATP-binding protein [Candidatus Deferrimicrobiaceae bacterium]
MKIRAVSLTKTYFKGSPHEVSALKNASIDIAERDFCLLTGPSGSGKTTLLCLLGLLTKPTQGKVYIDDEEVSSYSDAWQTKIRKNKIGFIFQQYNLLPQFTAWENVALPNLCRNTTVAERKQQALQIMTDLGLKERVDFKVASLSGGEQQRVAVARALITDPEIIFADEPTAAVDEETATAIIGIFNDLKQKGKTIIVSTHDKSLIKEGTMHLTINHGEIQAATRS